MAKSNYISHIRSKKKKGRFVFFRKKNRQVREALKAVA